jgi:hypothetical protein
LIRCQIDVVVASVMLLAGGIGRVDRGSRTSSTTPVSICPNSMHWYLPVIWGGNAYAIFDRSVSHPSPEEPNHASDSKPDPNYYEENTQTS